ncbi:hypothetical protein AML91_18905 [Paenibacillus jilunlii]|uniref:Uncharacterized protein n=1 Tax=Paenibacillus jilunlii TaxID=682956 RepID=A0ABR5SRH8_9BACL|nr:hypothetical protein AML91_18905 [Paenibacillus jilunlii]
MVTVIETSSWNRLLYSVILIEVLLIVNSETPFQEYLQQSCWREGISSPLNFSLVQTIILGEGILTFQAGARKQGMFVKEVQTKQSALAYAR